ncbi:MAG: anti-sigma factor [Ramlibacter sp.]
MDLHKHPELVDKLAAAYALGTLRGGARRRFETLARQSPGIRTAAHLWQERLMALTELQQSQAPGPNVWKRIENMLAAEARPAAADPADSVAQRMLLRARNLWRGAAVAAALAGLAAVVVTLNLSNELSGTQVQLAQLQAQGRDLARANTELVAQLQAQPEIRYVSVLHDDKATPTMLVMYDPKHNALTLKRVGGFQESPEHSLQLWALPEGGAPRSLGVLGAQQVLRMPMPEQAIGQAPAMAVSLEPKGGVPGEGGPTGPVLFKGAVLQTPL